MLFLKACLDHLGNQTASQYTQMPLLLSPRDLDVTGPNRVNILPPFWVLSQSLGNLLSEARQ